MTFAIALGIVLGGSAAILLYQWATRMLATPTRSLRRPLSDGWWPKGPMKDR